MDDEALERVLEGPLLKAVELPLPGEDERAAPSGESDEGEAMQGDLSF